jgi:hypothetical protein
VEEDLRVGLDGDLGVVGFGREREILGECGAGGGVGWIRGRVLFERWMGLEGRDGAGGTEGDGADREERPLLA